MSEIKFLWYKNVFLKNMKKVFNLRCRDPVAKLGYLLRDQDIFASP